MVTVHSLTLQRALHDTRAQVGRIPAWSRLVRSIAQDCRRGSNATSRNRSAAPALAAGSAGLALQLWIIGGFEIVRVRGAKPTDVDDRGPIGRAGKMVDPSGF
jgi:hypothetical protein